jgi:hypothetical protein
MKNSAERKKHKHRHTHSGLSDLQSFTPCFEALHRLLFDGETKIKINK